MYVFVRMVGPVFWPSLANNLLQTQGLDMIFEVDTWGAQETYAPPLEDSALKT